MVNWRFWVRNNRKIYWLVTGKQTRKRAVKKVSHIFNHWRNLFFQGAKSARFFRVSVFARINFWTKKHKQNPKNMECRLFVGRRTILAGYFTKPFDKRYRLEHKNFSNRHKSNLHKQSKKGNLHQMVVQENQRWISKNILR